MENTGRLVHKCKLVQNPHYLITIVFCLFMMIDERIIDVVSSAPIDIDPMFYVNTFFMIISMQVSQLFYELWREKYERKNTP